MLRLSKYAGGPLRSSFDGAQDDTLSHYTLLRIHALHPVAQIIA
jgi:hypothetical protein